MSEVILVTGATGFVGTALAHRLISDGRQMRLATRKPWQRNGSTESCLVGEIGSNTEWSEALADVSVVIHTAARVHVMNDVSDDPLAEFRRVNVGGTLHLARRSSEMGAKRFVFLSSIKVNGERTVSGSPFTAEQRPDPSEPYAISKMEAEDGLRALALETGMQVVIIRPPLVYGQGVKANFQSMMGWLWRSMPLPLGAVTENRRSLVALDNLVDLIVNCIDHPAAANQTFLVSDGEDLSTAALLRRLGTALGRPARLIPVPVALLKLGAALLGRSGVAQRLCESMEVDITNTRKLLGWAPPVSVDEGLRRTALHWINAQSMSSS